MSSDRNHPYGLRPVRHLNGSPWNGDANLYMILAADVAEYHIGDPVRLSGTTTDTIGIPTVTIGAATAGDAGSWLGPIVGVHPVKPVRPSLIGTSLALEDTHIPATKARDYYVMVADAGDLVFHIQNNGETLLVTAGGLQAAFQVDNPADNQFSATVIDGSTQATVDTVTANRRNLRLLRPVNKEDNFDSTTFGASGVAFEEWEVINWNYQLRSDMVT